MAAREQYGDIKDLTIAQGATISSSFQVPRWATFVGVYIPDLDVGAVSLNISKDNSTFIPVLDPIDGDDYVVLVSGADPGYVDISMIIGSIPLDWYLRFGAATQSSAAVTLTVSFRA